MFHFFLGDDNSNMVYFQPDPWGNWSNSTVLKPPANPQVTWAVAPRYWKNSETCFHQPRRPRRPGKVGWVLWWVWRRGQFLVGWLVGWLVGSYGEHRGHHTSLRVEITMQLPYFTHVLFSATFLKGMMLALFITGFGGIILGQYIYWEVFPDPSRFPQTGPFQGTVGWLYP